jgi:VCBS repeat-containing protein
VTPPRRRVEVTVGQSNSATGTVTGKLTATDTDEDTLTFSGSSTTVKGTVTVRVDGTFTYTPSVAAQQNAAASNAPSAAKTDTFNDGHGANTPVAVTVNISPRVNAAPVTST